MDSFKGSLTSEEAEQCCENGIRRFSAAHEIVKIPMADGGEGTMSVITKALGGSYAYVEAMDPLGGIVSAKYGIVGNTAIIEAAQASGLELIPVKERDPLRSSTYGTGQIILDALKKGCTRIIAGIGGSAANDGGAGMAEALGVRFIDKNGAHMHICGGNLCDIERIDTSSITPLIAGRDIIVACDVTNPICGRNGAAYVFAPQKGASPEDVVLLDNNLLHLCNKIRESIGIDVTGLRGGGAAGGLGAGLFAFCGAKIENGFNVVCDAVGFEDAMSDADLVITGEGCSDYQTAFGKLPSGAAKLCKKHGIPCMLLSGMIKGDITELYELGITSAFSAAGQDVSVEDAIRNARGNLENAACKAMESTYRR